MNVWLIIGAACMLPLCAAEVKKERQISTGELICELAIHHGMLPISALKPLLVVSKHTCDEATKKLDECRDFLKKEIQKVYIGGVVYSRDRLEAMFVKRNIKLSPGHRAETVYFNYMYVHDDANTCNYVYRKEKKCTNKMPFFTKHYACYYDLESSYKSMQQVAPSLNITVGCWDRNKKEWGRGPFMIECNGIYTELGWIAQTLPLLYDKIVSMVDNIYDCTYTDQVTCHQSEHATSQHQALVVDLAKTNILTKKDVQILSKFVPGGKYAKWFDTQGKNNGYFLFNVLVCYGSQRALFTELEAQVGKKKIQWGKHGRTLISRCRDSVEILRDTDGHNKYLGDHSIIGGTINSVSQATLNYIAKLKKEGVFVERGWHDNKSDFNRRLKRYNQAIKFLRHKRMRCFSTKDDLLIRHDSESNSVAVFQNMFSLELVLEGDVPRNIDPKSLTVCPYTYIDEKLFLIKTCKFTYKLLEKAEDSDSESSDVLVGSSDDE